MHQGATVTERTAGPGGKLRRRTKKTASPRPNGPRRLATGVGIGRVVTAAEVADVVTFLASPRNVAINGDAIAVSNT